MRSRTSSTCNRGKNTKPAGGDENSLPVIMRGSMEQHRFDLHMHSNRSDGADAPREVVQKAAENGLTLIALTDHDTIDGVEEAAVAGVAANIVVLPAIEMDTEWPTEMHILGLDIDTGCKTLTDALAIAKRRRTERNGVILEKLKKAGYDVEPHLGRAVGNVTRLHIALALVEAGYAETLNDAFARFLRRGAPGYYTVTRFSPEEVVAIIRAASGVPVWAHPFHGGGNVHAELAMLVSAGIAGIEAYHPSASEGQSKTLLSLARQNGLLVTCGSDSHGAHRAGVRLGCTWCAEPALEETYRYFIQRRSE